ncbi:MAG: 50S ribosomal protein L11 methyltransferase [Candidatus Nanopelagicales bacterium]
MIETQFNVDGVSLRILCGDDVFAPSAVGSQALAHAMCVRPGETVLDVGTGAGVLAILAAKMGGVVSATDILDSAVVTARANALLNEVAVDVRQGGLFSPFSEQTFDVIVANVPQDVLSPKTVKGWGADRVTSYSGGGDGTDILLETLRQAPAHMHSRSRLYCVVYSMTNHRKTLSHIVDHYSAKLVGFATPAVKDFVTDDLCWYRANPDTQIHQVGDRYLTDLYTFELTR